MVPPSTTFAGDPIQLSAEVGLGIEHELAGDDYPVTGVQPRGDGGHLARLVGHPDRARGEPISLGLDDHASLRARADERLPRDDQDLRRVGMAPLPHRDRPHATQWRGTQDYQRV